MVRCFLLGAGASYAIGQSMNKPIPLDKSFFELLEQRDNILYSNINKILQAQFGNIEKLKTLSLEKVEDLTNEIDNKYKKQLNKELKRAVYLLLGVNTETHNHSVLEHLKNQTGDPNLQLYDLILDNLSQGDFFVSLNYDILLDLAIVNSGRSIHYGNHFKETAYPHGMGNPISLYKPHGSLNWHVSDGVAMYVLEPDKIKIATRLSVLNDHSLISIWEEAIGKLGKADELIAIGSSLSDQDKHLMQCIKAWKMRSNTAKLRTKIIFASQDRTEYYNKLFEGYTGKLDLYSEGFDEKSIDFIFD